MNLDDPITRKNLYRKARLLMWSFIVTLAVLVLFRLIEVAPEAKPWTFLLFLFGFWVPIYHLLEWIKARIAAARAGKP